MTETDDSGVGRAWRRQKTIFSIFAGRYVEKILEKAVFPEKITGKKGAFFCRRILPIFLKKPLLPIFSKRYVVKKIEKTVFPKKKGHI